MNKERYEIGSFFENEESTENWFEESCDKNGRISAISWLSHIQDVYFFESGRSAESAIIDEIGAETNRHVCLMPEYTCDTVIKPFTNRGWEVYFYELNFNLEPNQEQLIKKIHIHNPGVIVTILYYGVDTVKSVREILCEWRKDVKGIILEDYTQALALMGKHADMVDYVMLSLRKWFPISGGGIAGLKHKPSYCGYNNDYVSKQQTSRVLKERYLLGDNIDKQLFLDAHYEAERMLDERYDPINMDLDSYNTLCVFDVEHMFDARRKNCEALKMYVNRSKRLMDVLDIVEGDCPLYYPILVDNRDRFQAFMRENHVYLPVLWPIPKEIGNNMSNYIRGVYNKMLAIPCDHRYDEEDMKYIGGLIEKYDQQG